MYLPPHCTQTVRSHLTPRALYASGLKTRGKARVPSQRADLIQLGWYEDGTLEKRKTGGWSAKDGHCTPGRGWLRAANWSAARVWGSVGAPAGSCRSCKLSCEQQVRFRYSQKPNKAVSAKCGDQSSACVGALRHRSVWTSTRCSGNGTSGPTNLAST